MSGQRVILFIAVGVLGVTLVTLALYFLTRQVDESPSRDGLQQAPGAYSMTLLLTPRADTIGAISEAPPAPRRDDDLAG